MSRFDVKTFFELTGKGGGPVKALGTAYGMPSCLLNLGAEALQLLPSPILSDIRSQTANGANRADDVIKAAFAQLRFNNGLIEYDTEDGTFRFVSDSSKNGIDRGEGAALQSLGSFVGALAATAGFGGRLYNNYVSTEQQVESLKDCIGAYNDYENLVGANGVDKRVELANKDQAAYNALIESQYGNAIQDVQLAQGFINEADNLINNIDSIFRARIEDPSLEPEFTDDYASIINGTPLEISLGDPEEEVKEIIRLAYGPPKSKTGKFLLSIDGLYYDSQTSGIIPALMEIENRVTKQDSAFSWKLEHDPNLGGKGRQLNLDDFKIYVNTILDPNIVDDSAFLSQYYTNDNLLVDLIGQKNRRVFDVSGQIEDYQASGASQALVSNLRQVMLSETSHYIEKINKRKKQIELAVKMPSIYGGATTYSPGNIPINDFSYLEGINFGMDISNQKRLILNQSEVSSVVLPLEVKFTKQIENSSEVILDHLLLSNIGIGNVVSDGSGVDASILGVVDQVATDGLICLYNYLSTDIEPTSSITYSLHNSSDLQDRLDAQLVGDPDSIFDQGVGVVYLGGVTDHSTATQTMPSAVGSYVKLPSVPELEDLLYNQRGATVETWAHVPELDGETYGFGVDGSVSGLYRLILANENTGLQNGVSAQSNILNLTNDNGTNVVNGLIMGFTRDRRLTQNLTPSNGLNDNSITNAKFFIAPTQSYDNSSVGFISRSYYDSTNCQSVDTWHNMGVNIWSTTGGASFSSCGKEFTHIAVTFNPPKNKISIYCDGVEMAVSSYGDVFGIADPLKESVAIPSMKKNNSFEYNTSSMSAVDVAELKSGPKLDQYFTPWILGGGYTDGMQTGNFMGGTYGGTISGLKGYLGGTKLYSRPLTNAEIVSNYKANKEFFKNISTNYDLWEPVISV